MKSDEAKETAVTKADEVAQGNGAPATASEAAGAEPLVGPEPLTAEQIDDLKSKAAKADEHWDLLLRKTADFENFKKRAARDRLDAIRYANEALLEKLIPVVDNFDAALAATTNAENPTVESLKQGVSMIYTQLKGVLTESGLEEIDATGQAFDPNWHEAVSQQETADHPEGHVMQQLRKGYKLKDRLIRPATVVVARKPAA